MGTILCTKCRSSMMDKETDFGGSDLMISRCYKRPQGDSNPLMINTIKGLRPVAKPKGNEYTPQNMGCNRFAIEKEK